MKGDPFSLWNFNSARIVSLNPELKVAEEGGSEDASTAIECTGKCYQTVLRSKLQIHLFMSKFPKRANFTFKIPKGAKFQTSSQFSQVRSCDRANALKA